MDQDREVQMKRVHCSDCHKFPVDVENLIGFIEAQANDGLGVELTECQTAALTNYMKKNLYAACRRSIFSDRSRGGPK
jgi:hypothetical protein